MEWEKESNYSSVALLDDGTEYKIVREVYSQGKYTLYKNNEWEGLFPSVHEAKIYAEEDYEEDFY